MNLDSSSPKKGEHLPKLNIFETSNPSFMAGPSHPPRNKALQRLINHWFSWIRPAKPLFLGIKFQPIDALFPPKKLRRCFFPPPIFDYLIPQRPNLLKRRFSSVGAPDPSQTTRRIKSTESGGNKRVFTICSSAKKHGAKKRLLQNSGWKRKPTKKTQNSQNSPKKRELKKSLFDGETTQTPGLPGDFCSSLKVVTFCPHEKKIGNPSLMVPALVASSASRRSKTCIL